MKSPRCEKHGYFGWPGSRGRYGRLLIAGAFGLLVGLVAFEPAARAGSDDGAGNGIKITTLSSRPDRVSGGSALVEITVFHPDRSQLLRVTLNGNDITKTFRPGTKPNSVIGLVTGLNIGRNRARG